MRQRISGWFERMSRHTSTPSPSGRRTSSTATSGAHGWEAPQRLVGGARLAHDLDLALIVGLQELADAAPDHLVVVEQEHSDRH